MDSKKWLVCNDLRDDVSVEFVVKDIDSNETLLQGKVVSKGDAVTVVGSVPYAQNAQRFYLVEWSSSCGAGTSHYLAGKPPFDLTQYRAWLKNAGFVQ